jgi:hypothetical protein
MDMQNDEKPKIAKKPTPAIHIKYTKRYIPWH